MPSMRLTSDIEEFLGLHRAHGHLTGDATEPTRTGYLLTVTCPCGAVFSRYVTPEEAAIELAALARRN